MKPRICILSFSPIKRDARVLRQIQAASQFYSVDVIGYGTWSATENIVYHSMGGKGSGIWNELIGAAMFFGGFIFKKLWIRFYWSIKAHIKAHKRMILGHYDLIHANDLHALPVAVEVSKTTGAKVLFDAHEYSPDQRTDTFKGRLRSPYASYLLREFGPGIDQLVTVSHGLARLYKELLGLDAEVVMNAPTRVDVQLRPIEGGEIHLVHHGNALRGRGLEILIKAMRYLDTRFHLNFILVGENTRYIRKIRRMAETIAPERIRFYDPVAPSEIVATLNQFDIGIFILPPSNLNYRYVLPNKFFDFVGAGLAIAVGPSPEMAGYVRKYKMGVIADGFKPENVVHVLADLDVHDIYQMKINAITASHELNAEIEQKKLLDVYEGLLSRS